MKNLNNFKNFTSQAFCCCSIKNFIGLIWMWINILNFLNNIKKALRVYDFIYSFFITKKLGGKKWQNY